MTQPYIDTNYTENTKDLEEEISDRMNIAIVGHVDHGKSTIIGRLLADTKSLPQGKLEHIKERCKRNSKPFEYSFLLDALKDEQAQGITIDTARVFFNSEKRKYIILDTPGHIEFLRNVVTGASRAEAALLIIDAHEGIQENSKRYCYMISLLGIKKISIVVNKMDLIDYSETKFHNIVQEYQQFLNKIQVTPLSFIPVSGKLGDNVASNSKNIPWYKGPSILSQLDMFIGEKIPEDQNFRMSVQDIYKFTENNDKRRIVAGTIESGAISVGEEVVFLPSGKTSKVQSIEGFNTSTKKTITAGYATGFTIADHLYIKRGQIMARSDQNQPHVANNIVVDLFWLGKLPFQYEKEYFIKIGAQKVPFTLQKIRRVIDATNLNFEEKPEIHRNEVAECEFLLKEPIAFDLTHELLLTSRFVIVDDFEIAGGGIISDIINNSTEKTKKTNENLSFAWERSRIGMDDRAERYNQKSSLILITGGRESRKKEIAKALEKELFSQGKFVYHMGIGHLLYGLDESVRLNTINNNDNHISRLAEIANIMLDSGCILIVTARSLNQSDLELLRKTLIVPEKLISVWIGNVVFTDIKVDYHLFNFQRIKRGVKRLKQILQDKGIIFKI
ncbi:GTP-binding protein [Candidatus Lokiarchaeum ossiferum]|uniref:GTP-binding protein n=1 Tax=Candidatus Lokiarchaeum ossiferum TaxID=2951803 RepID=UPI00352CFE46